MKLNALRRKDHNRYLKGGRVLLKTQIAITGEKYIKLSLSLSEKLAALDPAPTHLLDRRAEMTCKARPNRQLRHSSIRMRISC